MSPVKIEIEADDNYCFPAIHAPRTLLPIHECSWLDSSAPEAFLGQSAAITPSQPLEIQIQPEIQAAFDLMALATPPKRRAMSIDEESGRDNKRSRTRSPSLACSLDSVKAEFDEEEWKDLSAARTTEHYHPYSPSASPVSSASESSGFQTRSPSPAVSVKQEISDDDFGASRAIENSRSATAASSVSGSSGYQTKSPSPAVIIKQEIEEDERDADHMIETQTSDRIIKLLPSRTSESKPFAFADFLPRRVLYAAPTNPLPPIQSLGGGNSQGATLPLVVSSTKSALLSSRPFSFADHLPLPLLYGGHPQASTSHHLTASLATFDNEEEFSGTDSEDSDEDFEMDAAFAAGGVPMKREDPFDGQGVF